MVKRNKPSSEQNPWPHRLAVLLVCATFPLIWVGGMVTTTDAGMAVPDWPSTYGYNLFLYPWQTWILGPGDLFIEHGHRLLAVLVGLIAIVACVVVWLAEPRRWVRWLAVATLAAVVFQGLLGGARVIQDEVQLAKIHGCFGPAFFALCVALAVVTSNFWRNARREDVAKSNNRNLFRLGMLTTGLVYLQIVIGAHLRHLPVDFSPGSFRAVVFFHLLVAAAIVVHAALLLWEVLRRHRGEWTLVRPAVGLAIVVAVQIALGVSTWVVKYSWPAFLADYGFAAGYTVQADSYAQAMVVTAHQAVGSLLLGISMLLTLRGWRMIHPAVAKAPSHVRTTMMEVLA